MPHRARTIICAVVALLVPMNMNSDFASAQDALGGVRAALFKEDFAAARLLFANVADPDARARLTLVTDECELHALCEHASSLIDSGKAAAALMLLESSTARFAPSLTSTCNARGLTVLARALAAAAPAPDADLIKKLDEAIKDDGKAKTEREKLVNETLEAVRGLLTHASDTLTATQEAAARQAGSSVETGYLRTQDDCARATTLVEKIRALMNRDDYERERMSVDAQVLRHRDRIAEGLGHYYLDLNNCFKAAQVVEQGLLRSPRNDQLLKLRVLIEEFWKTSYYKD